MSDQIITEKQKTNLFKNLKKIKENLNCFDCNGKNPQWVSINFSILICLDCSAKHRSYGPNISFVRSGTLDNFTIKDKIMMEVGGNNKAREYLKIRNMKDFGDYKNDVSIKYKKDILKKTNNKLEELDLLEKEEIIEEKIPEQEIIIKKEEPIEKEIISKPKTTFKPLVIKNKAINKVTKGKKLDSEIDFDNLVIDEKKINSNKIKTDIIKTEDKPKVVPLKLNIKKENEIKKESIKIDLSKKGNIKSFGSDQQYSNNENNKQKIINIGNVNAFGSDQLNGEVEENNDNGFGNYFNITKDKLKNKALNIYDKFIKK